MVVFGEFRVVCRRLFPRARQFNDRAMGRKAGMSRTVYSAQIKVGDRVMRLVFSMPTGGMGDVELYTEPNELAHVPVPGGPKEQLEAYAAALKAYYGAKFGDVQQVYAVPSNLTLVDSIL